MILDINKFIKTYITNRPVSMFQTDIERYRDQLTQEIHNKRVLVIGGAGTIGSSFIRSILPFEPSQLTVVDINENGLTELTRDIRSTDGMFVPDDFVTYPLSYADPIFEKIFRRNNGFDIVANFSAHKHVRSEKDQFSVEALIENNVIKARKLLDLLSEVPPKHFFCVSTDKAANPVNVMGGSKKIMEDMIMSYSDKLKVCTARFANVAFSNGSLMAGWVDRLMRNQPLVAPNDVRRYFVSPDESGQICMLACILGKNREIFFPKLGEEKMMKFSTICDSFVHELGYTPKYCNTDQEAKTFASTLGKDTNEYPVVYFKSDTSGEKDFEEFFVHGESIDTKRFDSLGVIDNVSMKSQDNLDLFFTEIQNLFVQPNFTKAQVIEVMKRFIPNFDHIETGKSLDQKM